MRKQQRQGQQGQEQGQQQGQDAHGRDCSSNYGYELGLSSDVLLHDSRRALMVYTVVSQEANFTMLSSPAQNTLSPMKIPVTFICSRYHCDSQSGTTGRPKGVVSTHGGLRTMVSDLVQVLYEML